MKLESKYRIRLLFACGLFVFFFVLVGILFPVLRYFNNQIDSLSIFCFSGLVYVFLLPVLLIGFFAHEKLIKSPKTLIAFFFLVISIIVFYAIPKFWLTSHIKKFFPIFNFPFSEEILLILILSLFLMFQRQKNKF